MADSDPERTFGYVAGQMNRFGLAFLHIIEPRIKGIDLIRDEEAVAAKHIRRAFKGPIIAAGGFTKESAEAIIAAGDADLVAFGRHFISNPDLPHRFRVGAPLAPYDRDSFYGGGADGYTDYPFPRRAGDCLMVAFALAWSWSMAIGTQASPRFRRTQAARRSRRRGPSPKAPAWRCGRPSCAGRGRRR